jgi:hypothetical protein
MSLLREVRVEEADDQNNRTVVPSIDSSSSSKRKVAEVGGTQSESEKKESLRRSVKDAAPHPQCKAVKGEENQKKVSKKLS